MKILRMTDLWDKNRIGDLPDTSKNANHSTAMIHVGLFLQESISFGISACATLKCKKYRLHNVLKYRVVS
jgi:hypothetical protein